MALSATCWIAHLHRLLGFACGLVHPALHPCPFSSNHLFPPSHLVPRLLFLCLFSASLWLALQSSVILCLSHWRLIYVNILTFWILDSLQLLKALSPWRFATADNTVHVTIAGSWVQQRLPCRGPWKQVGVAPVLKQINFCLFLRESNVPTWAWKLIWLYNRSAFRKHPFFQSCLLPVPPDLPRWLTLITDGVTSRLNIGGAHLGFP